MSTPNEKQINEIHAIMTNRFPEPLVALVIAARVVNARIKDGDNPAITALCHIVKIAVVKSGYNFEQFKECAKFYNNLVDAQSVVALKQALKELFRE